MSSSGFRSIQSGGLSSLLWRGIVIARVILSFLLPVWSSFLLACDFFLVVLQVLLELLWLVFEEPGRVMAPVFVIGPFLVDVLVREELSHLVVACLRPWLLEPLREVLLPIGVDEVIA